MINSKYGDFYVLSCKKIKNDGVRLDVVYGDKVATIFEYDKQLVKDCLSCGTELFCIHADYVVTNFKVQFLKVHEITTPYVMTFERVK